MTLDTQITHGFKEVVQLKRNQAYHGAVRVVMLVWNKHQLVPAEMYRRYHLSTVDVGIAICENPNTSFPFECRKEVPEFYGPNKLGEDKKAAFIYHFESKGSG